MANGGWHTKADWERLEGPLRQLDPALSSFATAFALPLTKNRKDWPERSLEWSNGGIRRLLQVYLAEEVALTFNVWLCASQDRAGKRYWKREFLVSGRPVADFEQTFESLLLEGKAKLDSWTEDQLNFAVALDRR